jgi:hypothetical protein
MSELDRWLRRQAEREGRIVLLEEGLLGDRLWRYSWYRLRWFFLRYLFESITHAVTVLFLFRGLEWDNFLLVVVAAAATSLAVSFWWGALEGLRAQVRDLHRSGRPHRIAGTIGAWLALSLALSAVVVAAAAGWLVWQALTGGIGAADAFVAALLVRLAVELPIRTYHSGVYALRRVYKPLAASLAPELAGLAAVLVLWPLAGVWGLVVAALLNTGLLAALNLEYVGRVYHFLGLSPWRELRFARLPARESLAAGCSHAVMALDALAVLALLYGSQTDSEALLVLFLSMPTIRAGAEWARLLYFDLKRLELRLFTNLRRRFERHTLALAWLLGVLFWSIAAGIAAIYYREDIGGIALALLAFFLARSLLARAQVQAFAVGSYAAVLGTGAVCVAGLAAVGPVAEGEAERLAAVAAVTGICALALSRLTGIARARGEPGTALLTLEWLRRLGHEREAVRVGSARVVSAGGPERLDARTREERNVWRLSKLADRAARRVGSYGAAAWVGPDRLVWLETASSEPRITPDWLQRASGGLIAEVKQRECPTGEEALLVAGREQLLGYASPHLLAAIVPVDLDEARRTFEQLVADGVVYAPDEPVPAELARLPGAELRAILVDAVTFARDLRIGRRRSRFDVTPLCSGGELRLIFVADPQESSRRARGRWRHLDTTLNVRGAIAGVRGRQAPRVGRLAAMRA